LILAAQLLLATVFGVCISAQGQGVAQLETRAWREDIRVFAREILSRHRDAHHRITNQQFQAEVDSLLARAPALDNYEIVVALHRLAALIGDGHTFLATDNLYRHYPLELFAFGEDLRVVRCDPEYREALGARLVAIERTSVQEAQRLLEPLIPQGENQWYVVNATARLLVAVEPLAALKIIPAVGQANFTFLRDDGRLIQLRIGAHPAKEWIDASDRVALHRSNVEKPFWFTYLADARTVYVQFRSYMGLDQHARRLWNFIDSHKVERLIFDLRHNGGGNYTEARKHLVYPVQFMRLNRAGRLYVIIGRETFSAAMTNATDFRRETEAILVGEPTGARPNGFQENSWFTLPNSRLSVSAAKLLYRFANEDEDAVHPDQRIDPGWGDYRTGSDATLEWILAQPLPNSTK
jgi:Peptidase family S41